MRGRRQIDPFDGYNYLRTGMCLDWLDRHAEAGPFYRRAERLDPNGYFTVANIGWHYIQVGDYLAAREWLERSLRLEWSENVIGHSYLNWVEQKLVENASGKASCPRFLNKKTGNYRLTFGVPLLYWQWKVKLRKAIMKFFQAFVSAIVGGFVLTLAAGAHAQSTSQTVCHHRPHPGRGALFRRRQRVASADRRPDLGPGNVIQSAPDAKVDIVLGDKITGHIAPFPDKVAPATDAKVRDMISYKAVAEQNVIRMEGDTVLAIDKLSVSNMGVDAVERHGTGFAPGNHLRQRQKTFRRVAISD